MKPVTIFTALTLILFIATAFAFYFPNNGGLSLVLLVLFCVCFACMCIAADKQRRILYNEPVSGSEQQQNRTNRVQPEVEVKFITAEDVERIVKERIEQYINSQTTVKDSPIQQEPIQEVVYASMSERKKAEAEGKIIIAQPVTQVEQEPEIKKEVMPLEPPSYLGNKQILEMLIALFEKKPEYRDARNDAVMYIMDSLCENITNREYLVHIAFTTDRYFRYIQQKLPKMRGKTWVKRQKQSGQKDIIELTPEQQEAADLFLKQLKLF